MTLAKDSEETHRWRPNPCMETVFCRTVKLVFVVDSMGERFSLGNGLAKEMCHKQSTRRGNSSG